MMPIIRPSPEEPKGMHKKTFERLSQAVFEAVDEEEEAYKQALRLFAERLERRNRKSPKDAWLERCQRKLSYLT
jgi:hypothetical protein